MSQERLDYHDTYSDLDVKDIIKNLKNDIKEVVVLYYFEDLGVKEISEILEIPQGTVKSRLSRARIELEKVLIKNGDIEGRKING